MILVRSWYGFGMVLCGFDMVLVCFFTVWYGVGMFLVWFGNGSGTVWRGFCMVLVWL